MLQKLAMDGKNWKPADPGRMITRSTKGGAKSIHSSIVDKELINRRLPTLLFLFALLAGLVSVLPPGTALQGDDVSYLDIGDAYFRGDWKAALNAQWSPLYSWIQGLALHLFKPSVQWEPRIVQLTNFFLFVFAVICFHFFWKQVIHARSQGAGFDTREHTVGLPEPAFWALGYAVLLLLHLPDLAFATPDICFAGLIYLAAGQILRIRTRSRSWLAFLVFGFILGLGYLARTVMMPLAVVFLTVAILSTRNRRRAPAYGLVAIVAFLVVAGPFVFALSKAKGRFTFGDTGFLNYAWHVNDVPFVHWQGDLPGLGTPIHPTRRIFQSPDVYEFAALVAGTYPPWYDPSYWNEGLRPRFRIAQQIRALQLNLGEYWKFLKPQSALIVGSLILLAMRRRGWGTLRGFAQQWFLLAPAFAAIAAYGLVAVESRYVAPFFVLLWAAVFSQVSLPDSEDSRRLISTVAIIMLVLTSLEICRRLVLDTAEQYRDARVQLEIVQGVKQMGIQPGEKIAALDADLGQGWQRLCGLSVIAEIPTAQVDSFWAADAEKRARVYEALEKTGARLLVSETTPAGSSAKDWKRVGVSPVYVLFLKK